MLYTAVFSDTAEYAFPVMFALVQEVRRHLQTCKARLSPNPYPYHSQNLTQHLHRPMASSPMHQGSKTHR